LSLRGPDVHFLIAARQMLLIICSLLSSVLTCRAEEPFSVFAVDIREIRAAIAKVGARPRPDARVSGITVPHHLLAADLMAQGFWSATGGDSHERIVVLLPDHFGRSKSAFASTERSFTSVLGPVPNDVVASRSLPAHQGLFEASDLFEKEHGLQVLLPFIAHYFPGVPIVPIAISARSKRNQWDEAIAILRPLLTRRTLIVQSTDFSHYLPLELAKQRDQEVLNVLATADIESLAAMRQPDHMDSIGAQYLQTQLQEIVFGARSLVIANLNSQDYIGARVDKTTSYIVQVFCRPDQFNETPCQRSPTGRTFYFAGDTLLGRNFFHLLEEEAVKNALADAITEVTGGAPIILNLEGVILDEIPEHKHSTAMVMPRAGTVNWLTRINVIAVSLANNHSMDFGAEAYSDMVKVLEDAGIMPLAHGELKDVGPFRLWALTDLSSSIPPYSDRIQEDELGPSRVQGVASPLVALLHWGREGVTEPAGRELMLADILRQRAVVAIVGAHSHKASKSIISLAGGESQMLLSLGNFLFDQIGPEATGAMLEMTVFDQGTVFTRLRPIANLYELALGAAKASR
jgi:AmmeMemoRadiSam system protein B